MVGQKIRHYRIEERLSRGGSGEVYRARDEHLRRDVAIKFLRAESGSKPLAVARFVREARAASALNHPNIITILDAGESRVGRFIVMELVQGVTLREWIHQRHSPESLVPIVTQIAKALFAAHDAGIIHRDIKPENIMVRTDGLVKVLDFGLARWENVGTQVPETTQTVSGTLIGTLRYMSPEQARGEPPPSSSDIFSLGIVLYELVTGNHPFESNSELATLQAICSRPVVAPSQWVPGLSPVFDSMILRMLDRDSRNRPTAEVILRVFEQADPLGSIEADARVRQLLVGRFRELETLRSVLDSTCQGNSKLVLIGGEPGIGKTALVESFLKGPNTLQRGCSIGRGSSSERLAGTEAYLPLFEALEDLIKTPTLAQVMRQVAPNWYAHVARDSSDEAARLAAGTFKTSSRELLNRELMTFLKQGSLIVPIVLFVDDLHWADESTVDLLTYVTMHFDSARVLIVATYRPEELHLHHERFALTAMDLQARRRSQTIDLGFLHIHDVGTFVSLEFPQNSFPDSFSKLIHTKTEGNPLFMVEVLRYLRDKEIIVRAEGSWRISGKLPDIERELPQSISGMIRRKIDAVTEQDRRLLAAASVQGIDFDSAVTSRTLQKDPADVEEDLTRLYRVHGFVRPIGEKELPDGSITATYRFVHFLYYDAFYSALQPARKASWSAVVAQSLLHVYQGRAKEIAAQLAFHFEAARDFPQAARYFSQAAENAMEVFAFNETELLARRGLRMLESIPDSLSKTQSELDLQFKLGTPLLSTRGYGNLEVQKIFDRARQLCAELGESPRLFPALWGLESYYASRLELPPALDIAEQLLRLSRESGDPVLESVAHLGAGASRYFAGQFEESLDNFGRYRTLDNPATRVSSARRFSLDPGIMLRAFEARVFWWMGFPDGALVATEESLALARSLSHAPTLAFVIALAATTRQVRGDIDHVEPLARELKAQGAEHGLSVWLAEAQFFEGWVHVQRGKTDFGIEQMREGIAAYRATGTQLFLPQGYSFLAEAYGKNQRPVEGLQVVQQARELSCFKLPYPIFYTAELLRVESELMISMGNVKDAETQLFQGRRIAREQKARACELRIATSLSKLKRSQNQKDEARAILKPIYESFSEGFETTDLKEAKAELTML